MWDVDGTGLQPIGDASIAKALLDKVHAFNLRSALYTALITGAFVVLPELF